MTKKNARTLVIGLLVIVVFLGIYLGVTWYTQSKENEQFQSEKQQAENAIVLSLAPEQIERLSFPGEEGALVFEQKEGVWINPEDTNFEMNPSRLNLLLNDLAALTATRILENAGDSEQYGLGEEAKKIAVTDTEGAEINIYFGRRNSSNHELYFRIGEDSDTVYLTSAALDSHFSGRLEDFAQYESFPEAAPESMRIFRVDKEEDSYVLDMPGDDNCTVTDEAGNSQKANLNIVGTMQNNLSNTNWAKNVEYYCRDFGTYGLDTPTALIEVVCEGADGESEERFTLSVGGQDEDENYYVRLDDSMQVHTIRQEYLADFVESKPTTFWSLTYSFVSIGDMEKLEVTADGETYTMQRMVESEGQENEEISWLVNGKNIAKNLFTDFYYACVSVTAQERLDEVPKVEGAPALELHYYLTDGSEKTIQYYEYDQNFYTVLYEDGTKAAHTNKLYVNTMLENLDAVVNALER